MKSKPKKPRKPMRLRPLPRQKFTRLTADKIRFIKHFRKLVAQYCNLVGIPPQRRLRYRVERLPPKLASAIDHIIWSTAKKAVDRVWVAKVGLRMGYTIEDVLIFPNSEVIRDGVGGASLGAQLKCVLRKVRGK